MEDCTSRDVSWTYVVCFCLFRVRVQGISWGTSGLCAHVPMKGDKVWWNWLVVAWDSEWCISLPSSVTGGGISHAENINTRWIAKWYRLMLYHVPLRSILGSIRQYLPLVCVAVVCVKQGYSGIGGYVYGVSTCTVCRASVAIVFVCVPGHCEWPCCS